MEFAYMVTSKTLRNSSFRTRRYALSVTQIQQEWAVSQRTFKWLHCAELYSRSRCHEITSFFFHSRSFNSGLLSCISRIANKDLNHSYINIYARNPPKMSEEEDTLVKTRHAFEDLCRALNMDEESSNRAWRSYENISKNYTLEVKWTQAQCTHLYP